MLIYAFRSVDKPIPILLHRVYYIKKKYISIIVVVFRTLQAAYERASTVPSTSSSSSMRAVYIYIIRYELYCPRSIAAGS